MTFNMSILHSSVSFILLTFVTGTLFCSSEGNIFHQYSSYGTELRQADRFVNHSNRFDESGFNGRFRNCFSNHFAIVKCWHSAMKDFREGSQLWNIATDSKTGQLDCRYNVEPIHLKHERSLHLIEYKFIMNQINCASHLQLAGETTFEVFGTNDLFLAACAYEDEFNGLYHVVCKYIYTHIDSSLQS